MNTSTPPEENLTETGHRERLLQGMARALAARGYAQTSIADIVREAAVSRRTFYEHFAGKTECLLALYEAASGVALKVLVESVDRSRPWQVQVDGAVRAYLECLASDPVLLRTLFVEILGLGLEGLAVRRRVHLAIADFIGAAVPDAQGQPLDRQMAMTVVGGIHELVLLAVEEGREADLTALVEPATRLVRAVAQR
ncbi:MAG: TetR/AcrR family transcriptional regulator [Gammaproteobacteria bacterium]|uniref:TetR/AcrR family transcriptional regulator n=1 Tax=Pseudacidovorax sp. TaxID=1934311 RepID=UPI001B509EBA|nr:TetR/AcrR family transcriptional regulator [Pseudacidovorax sp.]MBP6894787.1 TetR/AcrR family transcriptional regulator [Pseudacidovorax sp.]